VFHAADLEETWYYITKLSAEFNYCSYLFNLTLILHEAQIELNQISQNRHIMQKIGIVHEIQNQLISISLPLFELGF
jgi:hypothetical protein